MNTLVWVMLGNGDNFAFDNGEGSVANYVASGIALNEIKKVPGLIQQILSPNRFAAT